MRKLLCIVVQACLMTSMSAQAPESKLDARVASIAAHLDGLLPISASVTYGGCMMPGFRGDAAKTNAWLSSTYNKVTSWWQRSDEGMYEIDYDASGATETLVSAKNNVLEYYYPKTRRASVVPGYDWVRDVTAECYFLFIPPVPYRPFLEDAKVSGVSSDQFEISIASAVNPAATLLLYCSRSPDIHVEKLEHHKKSRHDGRDILLARYTFSNFIMHNGQLFPSDILKEVWENEVLVATRSCHLEVVDKFEDRRRGFELPSGTVFRDATVHGERGVILGVLGDDFHRNALEMMRAWQEKARDVDIFSEGCSTATELASRDELLDFGPSDCQGFVVDRQKPYEHLCGCYCLRLIESLLGHVASKDVYREFLFNTDSKNGLSLQDLAEAAGKRRFASLACQATPEELRQAKCPAILQVRSEKDAPPSHYVVLAGTRTNLSIIIDPPDMPVFVNGDWWYKYYTGNALVLATSTSKLGQMGQSSIWPVSSIIAAFALVCMIKLWRKTARKHDV